jgi:hypothetical protein
MYDSDFESLVFNNLFEYFDQDIIRDKINIIKKKDYDKDNRISIYQTPFNSIIFSCSKFYKNLNRKIDLGDKKISIDQLKGEFNNQGFSKETNTHCLFLNPENQKRVNPPKDYIIKEIDEKFEAEFNELKTDCSKQDLNEAQVSLSDDYIVGCFYEKKLVAVASYWYWGDNLADIGIITHPKYRNNYLAKASLSYLSLQGIKNDRINIYRYAADNKASKRLALAINFEEKMFIETTKLL